MMGNQTEWKTFTSLTRSVSGRVIRPSHEAGDLILFCPGFPGTAATLYEQRHVERFQEEMYTQVVLRHNGLILDGEHSLEMLNARQFPHSLPVHRQGVLGGKPARMVEWVMEPQTFLEAYGSQFTNIFIVAHSFGAVAALNSLTNLNQLGHPVLERVRACLCLAPALGTLEGSEDDNIMRLWQADSLISRMAEGRILFEDGDDLQGILRGVYSDLPKRVHDLPGSVRLEFVHVVKDEYIRETDIAAFCKACGREGRYIKDEFDTHLPIHGGIDAHDMPSYPNELLLEMIETEASLVDLDGIYRK